MAQTPKTSKKKNKEMTDDSDSFIRMLHDAAIHGDRKKLQKILNTGLNVDHVNSLGQTPLFLACFEGQRRLAKLLLKNGANPNARNLEGSTPVHAASFTADVKLFGHLLDAGGDLRLHDNTGRSPRDWASRQPNVKKRKSFLDFIDEIRAMANYSYGMAPSNKLCGRNPAFQKFHKRQWRFQQKLSPLFQNFGYGLVHEGRFGYDHAVRGFVPVIPESHLKHDNAGPTYNNGQFMVMERGQQLLHLARDTEWMSMSCGQEIKDGRKADKAAWDKEHLILYCMLWKNVPVTVKRLHRTIPAEQASVDLLIQELEFVSCLQHPNILLILAACQNNSMEGMVLLYEKVRCGSLDAHLYQRGQTLAEKDVYKIFYQVSSGLVYLHQRGIVHCCITSHAIQLVLPNYAKLSNFEYARTRVSKNVPGSVTVLPKFAYNWMSPELLSGQQNIMEESDVYSLTAVLWEVLSGTPPWCGKQPDDIVAELVTNKRSLPLENIHSPFDDLLVHGLNLNPADRIIDIAFRDMMWQGIRTSMGDPQLESNDRQSSPVPTNLNGLAMSASSMYSGRPVGYAVYHASRLSNEVPLPESKFTSKTSEKGRLAEHSQGADLQAPQSLKKTGSMGGTPMDTRRLEQMMDRLVELEKSERPNQRMTVPNPSPNEPEDAAEESDEDRRCMNTDVDEPDRMELTDVSQTQVDSKVGQFTVRQTLTKSRNAECDGETWKINHEIDLKGMEGSGRVTCDQFVYSVHTLEKDKDFSRSGGDSGLDAEAGERSNPFLDKELRKQGEEICKQLLSRPLPKLPIPQKLTIRHCEGESIQKPTVYGTILREYSQSRQATTKHGNRPTFGISLTELKAAVRPRISGGQGVFRHRRDTSHYSTLQPGLNISSSYQSSSKTNLSGTDNNNRTCTFKPASHREPSLNISPSKHSTCPLPNFSIPPPSSSSAAGIGSASYIVDGAESLGAESAAGFRVQTFPRRTSYNITSMASYDHADRDDSEADMIRFKSDPLLQRKIYLREFARGQIQRTMPTMQGGQLPYNGGDSLEDLEEDDNLEELIGKNCDRPQQAGSLPPRYSLWNDPSAGWPGSNQDKCRFMLDKNKKKEDPERQRYFIKEEVSDRQRSRDGSQRHTVKEEDSLRKESSRGQDTGHPINKEDSQRVIKRDSDRGKHGDAEHDRTQENLRCHFCEQELAALTPKASQLSRINSSTRQSIKSTSGRTDSKAETKVHEEASLIRGKQRTDWPVVASCTKQRAADGNVTELEDFYFDDDLHSSSLYKEKYMRLQSTMAMDINSISTPHALSSFTSPIYGSQRSATAVASSSSERERMAGIQVAGKSIPESTSATKSIDASTSSRKSATCPEKWLMASHSHNMSTITVESDSQGHHRICLKKIDPLTGTESTTYKASVVADQVRTQVFLGNADDHADEQAKNDDADDNDEDDDDEGESDGSSSDSETPYPV